MGNNERALSRGLGKRRSEFNDQELDDYLSSWKPVRFVPDPSEIVPHDRIPSRLRNMILDTISEEQFLSQEWDIGRLKRLAQALFHPRENMTRMIAQVCNPQTCPFADLCQYDIIGAAPVGERCPKEIETAMLFYREYVSVISGQLRMDEEDVRSNIILHNLIMEIVESDITQARLDGMIAEHGMISERVTAVIAETGQSFTEEVEAVPVRIKERVARRKDQLFRQILATPEMSEKYKRGEKGDVVSRAVAAIEKLEKLAEQRLTITDGEAGE